MGPGIAAEPHCAELGSAGVRSGSGSFRGTTPHPCRSWRARSGVASVSVGHPVARAFPRSLAEGHLGAPTLPPTGSAFVCRAEPVRSEDLPGSTRSRRRSLARSPRFPAPLPCGSARFGLRSGPAPGLALLQVLASQSLSERSGHRLSVRGPSWDDPPSRCPGQLLAERPGLRRREKPSLPAPLAGLAPEILRLS